MTLPLTPNEEAWMKRMDIVRVEAVKAARGAKGKQCRDCQHGRGHPFSPKYFYCAIRGSNYTGCGMAKTKRTNTCEKFTPKKP